MNDTNLPAVLGGPRAIASPLTARRSFGAEEKAAVDALFDEAIRTGNAIGYNGEQEEAFCREFSEYMGGGYADAVNSGTGAVYAALKALEIEPFSEVIVGAINDPGGIMPIPLIGCIPVIADTAKDSYNSCVGTYEPLITPLTRAIIVQHIGGEPADIDEIVRMADTHGIPVIEDCSQSHHAMVNGKKVGTFGAIAVQSTMFGKHFNSGGQGGLLYTRSEELYWKIRRSADRGKPFGLPAESTNCLASLNLNSSEISAAIGRQQLRKLPQIAEGRRAAASMIARGLRDIPSINVPAYGGNKYNTYWWWRLEVNTGAISCAKEEYCRALSEEGLPVTISYRSGLPHKMDWFVNRRAFAGSGFPWNAPQYKGRYAAEPFETPNAEAVLGVSFNLNIHESWGRDEADQILSAFRKIHNYYAK